MTAAASDVREHGMLFSAPMIRALLDETKTQTRRVLTDRNTCGNFKASELDLSRAWVDPGPSPAGNPGPYLKSFLAPTASERLGHAPDDIVERLYPRYRMGDLIWARETWGEQVQDINDRRQERRTVYRATSTRKEGGITIEDVPSDNGGLAPWRPSIHMPRRLTRAVRVLTAVRPERVQDITRTDVEAEGIDMVRDGWQWKDAYRALWDSLNGKRNGGAYSWASNPWVLALEFQKVSA